MIDEIVVECKLLFLGDLREDFIKVFHLEFLLRMGCPNLL